MFLVVAIVCGVISLDVLSKLLTVRFLKPVGSLPIIRDVLHLTYVENTGMAFGLLKDHRWIFLALSTVLILGIIVYLIIEKPKSKLLTVSLSFVLGGGIGNMIDRIVLGYVVDMIDFRLIDFAVFNVADSFVTVGGCMIALYLILEIVREARAEKERRHD